MYGSVPIDTSENLLLQNSTFCFVSINLSLLSQNHIFSDQLKMWRQWLRGLIIDLPNTYMYQALADINSFI